MTFNPSSFNKKMIFSKNFYHYNQDIVTPTDSVLDSSVITDSSTSLLQFPNWWINFQFSWMNLMVKLHLFCWYLILYLHRKTCHKFLKFYLGCFGVPSTSILTKQQQMFGLLGCLLQILFVVNRLIQIAQSRFPTIYNTDEMVEKVVPSWQWSFLWVVACSVCHPKLLLGYYTHHYRLHFWRIGSWT